MKLLVIDNYDSFTYNLVQYLGELGASSDVVRNDAIAVEEIGRRDIDAIVISPGPCTPNEAGISVPTILRYAGVIPILGVCLGHQSIGQAFGGRVVHSKRLMHGKTSQIRHRGTDLFSGMPDPFEATRYHSLAVARDGLPSTLVVTAETEDLEIMGMRHAQHAVFGVQFHPESILTVHGKDLLANFLRLARDAGREGGVMSAALERAVSGELFSRAEMRALVREIMNGALADVQIAGILAALRTRGETLDETVGAAEAMRELALPLPEAPFGAIDTCGTGGDGANTFNISTVSALVVAGSGVPVAKHGNRAASSRCGSAELLEALGVAIDISPERMARAVHEIGIGFLYARMCHPAMARVAPVRAALGIRTLFNRLGPLTNPMRVRRQLVGVATGALVEPTLAALVELGAERVWVVHGEDGLDELSISAPTRVAAYADGRTERFIVGHGEMVPEATRAEIAGGDAAENARIARAVLTGEKSARRDAVLLNSAAALCVAGRARDLREGVRLAGEALDSGRASALLERFAAFTKREAS